MEGAPLVAAPGNKTLIYIDILVKGLYRNNDR